MQTKIIIGTGLSDTALDSLKAEIAKVPNILIIDDYQYIKDTIHELSYDTLCIKETLPKLEKVKEDGWYRKFEKRRF